MKTYTIRVDIDLNKAAEALIKLEKGLGDQTCEERIKKEFSEILNRNISLVDSGFNPNP